MKCRLDVAVLVTLALLGAAPAGMLAQDEEAPAEETAEERAKRRLEERRARRADARRSGETPTAKDPEPAPPPPDGPARLPERYRASEGSTPRRETEVRVWDLGKGESFWIDAEHLHTDWRTTGRSWVTYMGVPARAEPYEGAIKVTFLRDRRDVVNVDVGRVESGTIRSTEYPGAPRRLGPDVDLFTHALVQYVFDSREE